jgi:hypothetical protein
MTDETQAVPDFPAPWRPDQTDSKTIKGVVQDVTMSPDFGYGPYPIVTIVDETGAERAIHVMGAVLRSEMAKRRPGRGDEIEVTYLGTRAPKSGTGKPYRVYKVTGGKEPVFNWDAELPAEEREAFHTTPPATAEPPMAAAPVPAAAAEPVGQQFGEEAPF